MSRWRKLGLIAGGGPLPARIVAERQALGEPFHVVRITGSADETTAHMAADECGIGEAGKILRKLRDADCDAVCFAGVVRRPEFSSLKVDWRGAALLPKIAAAAARGDGAILDVLVETLEAENFLVVGADEAVGGLTASIGAIGSHSPSKDDIEDIAKAAALINAIGPFDVGQGAVVAHGHVLAVEAAEGTDLMLARCAELPGDAREEARGVLVKRPKPGQELRVDLPVVGPETIKRAAAARLRGVAVEAGVALLMNRDEAARVADEAGMFLYGFTAAELNEK
jgi:DUF1009 family protein